jgi:hypothetical protein
MITGFCTIPKENQKKVYDYSGCMFPEGFLVSDQVCLFDHEQIEKIYHMGYEDDEEKKFKNKLQEVLKKVIKTEKKDIIFKD